MTIIINQIDNNYIFLSAIVLTAIAIIYFKSSVIETPNSPPTFNLNPEQLKEVQDILDQDFIKSGENCYPKYYPMRSADDPIPEYSNFNLDFSGMRSAVDAIPEYTNFDLDSTTNLIEKMGGLSINCPFEGNELLLKSIIAITHYFKMNFLLELLLSFILGFLFFFLVNYLRSLYFKKHEKIVFTKGISSDVITFTRDYQELLSGRLGDDPGYDIIYKDTYYHILNSIWTLFDIIDWLKSIDDQDYAVTLELFSDSSDDLFLNHPRIILSNEFIVNKYSNPVLISSLLSSKLEQLYKMFDAEYNDNHYIVIRYGSLIASY